MSVGPDPDNPQIYKLVPILGGITQGQTGRLHAGEFYPPKRRILRQYHLPGR